MKKSISVFLAAVLAAGVLLGCSAGSSSPAAGTEGAAGAAGAAGTGQKAAGSESQENTETAESGTAPAETEVSTGADPAEAGREEPLQIVTMIFPEYDWVQNILGDKAADAEVTMLLDNGVDLHSYQPTAADILKIAGCDLFIYVGGESDEWVDDALAQAVNPDMVVLNLLETLGDTVKEEEIVEGMEEGDHDHDHEEAEGEAEYDEHVWLSLRNASVICGAVSDALSDLDPANAAVYSENLKAYREKLDALDRQYEEAVTAAPVKTLLFGDRFPFRYLTDDYGLDYYAAFAGCSAETEASFETILFLANKVDELALHTVLTIEGSDHRIAETIVENTKAKDQEILSMDSMQSTTSKDVADGAAYYSVMEKNLEILKQALQ